MISKVELGADVLPIDAHPVIIETKLQTAFEKQAVFTLALKLDPVTNIDPVNVCLEFKSQPNVLLPLEKTILEVTCCTFKV